MITQEQILDIENRERDKRKEAALSVAKHKRAQREIYLSLQLSMAQINASLISIIATQGK